MLPRNWLASDLRALALLAPVQELQADFLDQAGVRLFIKREDLLHPVLGGNKLYKLHGYLRAAQDRAPELPIASFGGAYSNHLLALAAAGQQLELKTIAIVRGEAPAVLSPTLSDAQALGMRLMFVSRQSYRRRHDSDFLSTLEKDIGPCFWIPEGGAGHIGARGFSALASSITTLMPRPPDIVLHACGTGTSVAGLAAGFGGNTEVWGIPVLKARTSLMSSIDETLSALGASLSRWRLIDDYHWGGYGKYPAALAEFVRRFEANHTLRLDPVYTSKVMWAIVDLINKRRFSQGTVLVMVHSGGLQGRRGYALDEDNSPEPPTDPNLPRSSQ